MKKFSEIIIKSKNFRIITVLITLIFLYPISLKSHEIKENKIEKIIHNFLVNNPELLRSTLDSHKINLEKQKIKNTIETLKNINNPGVFQNNADITIYEFFDYNC